MVIIISGLPGTGKTTLCKMIEKSNNYKYISDWQIFDKNNIKFNKLDDKNLITEFSNHLSDFCKIVLRNISSNNT